MRKERRGRRWRRSGRRRSFFNRLEGADVFNRGRVANKEDEELDKSREGRGSTLLAAKKVGEVEDVSEIVDVRSSVVLQHPLILSV